MMWRILIADRHSVFRRGLRAILAAKLKTSRFGEAQSLLELSNELRKRSWDLVILGTVNEKRPHVDLHLLNEWTKERAGIPVPVLLLRGEGRLSSSYDFPELCQLMSRDRAPRELIKAAGALLARAKSGRPTVVQASAPEPIGSSDKSPLQDLSKREREVVTMITSGLQTKQVAARLHLGVSTVSTYRSRALSKLRMRTTGELIRYAVEHQLAK